MNNDWDEQREKDHAAARSVERADVLAALRHFQKQAAEAGNETINTLFRLMVEYFQGGHHVGDAQRTEKDFDK